MSDPRPDGDFPEGLRQALEDRSRCLILTHDNPDPDALASAFALAHLLEESLALDATVAFSGVIGRAENRAMVHVLGIVPEPLSTVDMSSFDGLALVDSQPGSGNTSLPGERVPDVVIDHHPLKMEPHMARFADVRPDYGSTATILAEYARGLEMEWPVNLATALFYALKSETQDLGREAAEHDRAAYFDLLAHADMGAVSSIQRARVPREYFRAFRTGIERAEVLGRLVVTDLGVVSTPDMVAEIADFLLRLQEVDWSCCLGRHENTVVVSLRTSDVDAHAGRLIREAVKGLGTAGGHGTMAGAQIPVSDRDVEETLATVRRRIVEELARDQDNREPLVAPRD